MQAEIPSSQLPEHPNLFAAHLTPNPQTVLTISSQHLTQLSSFTEAFRQRIVIELQYAKNLSSVSSLLNQYINPQSNKAISFVCSAWKVENEQRAQQANELAETLRCEVYERLVTVKEEVEEKVKAMEKEVKKYVKQHKTLNDRVCKAYRQYQSRSQSLQQNRIYLTYLSLTNTIQQQKKPPKLQKLSTQITSTQTLHTSYHTALTQYNTFITEYQTIISRIKDSFSSLQQKIRQSLTLETDSLRKLIVGEVSMFKNIEYDLIGISKQMEEVSGQKDLQGEVEKAKGKKGAFELRHSEVDKTLLDHSLHLVENKVLGQLKQLQTDYNFVTILEQRWKQLSFSNQQTINKQPNQAEQHQPQTPSSLFSNLLASSSPSLKHLATQPSQLQQNFNLLTQYICQIFLNRQVTPITPPKKHSKKAQSLTPLTFIKRLFNASHFYRVSACAFVKMCMADKQPIKDESQIKLVANFINALIIKSSKHYDVIVLRQLLPLIFQIQFISAKTKRPLYLQPLVNKNFLWKRQDFWETAIYEDIYEAMSLSYHQGQTTGIDDKGEKEMPDQAEKEQQAICSILSKYSRYMLMLGIGQKDVKSIVGRFIKLCELTEAKVKQIDNVSEQVSKEYRELALAIVGQKRQVKIIAESKGQ